MKRFLPYIPIAIVTVLMLIFPKVSIYYAKETLYLAQDVIIPSLFPFFICSGLLLYSGLAEALSKFCAPIMRPLFNVGGSGSAALVLGTISGYPQGAITACQLYESGYLSQSETQRLLAFCNNSGPLFILGAVGFGIYSNGRVGLVLYISHIFSTLLVGFLFRFYNRNKHQAPPYSITQTEESFSQVFSKVLSNSINSILIVCGAIIFFGAISGIIMHILPVNDIIKAIIYGVLELSGGTQKISTTILPLTIKLAMSAFFIGFAGICVHIQVAAIVAKHHLSLFPYIIGKILHGLFSSLFTLLYFVIFPPETAVFVNTSEALGAGFCMSSLYSVINIFFFLLLTILFFVFTSMGVLQKIKSNKKRDI